MDKSFIDESERLEEMANGVLAVPENYKPAKPKTQLNAAKLKELKAKLNRSRSQDEI